MKRLKRKQWKQKAKPMLRARNICYEMSEKAQAIDSGGIGAFHCLASNTGLIQAIDEKLHLLKRHLPYHESDHVLNFAYNVLAGGRCLEDLELLRNDEVYLDALGAQRIPDPTTAGDFCRRFKFYHVEWLMEAINVCSGVCPNDSFLEPLFQKISDQTDALRRLKDAVRGFDEACIYTIHGFCNKMLHENAFESGSLFDVELVTSQEHLKQEIMQTVASEEDFRSEVAHFQSLFAG